MRKSLNIDDDETRKYFQKSLNLDDTAARSLKKSLNLGVEENFLKREPSMSKEDKDRKITFKDPTSRISIGDNIK